MSAEVELQPSDEQTLTRLNQEYVNAFMNADVDWYREHLADDFVVIESDGSLLNKEQFLKNTLKGPDVADYKLHEVDIRIYGHEPLHRCVCAAERRLENRVGTDYADFADGTARPVQAGEVIFLECAGLTALCYSHNPARQIESGVKPPHSKLSG